MVKGMVLWLEHLRNILKWKWDFNGVWDEKELYRYKNYGSSWFLWRQMEQHDPTAQGMREHGAFELGKHSKKLMVTWQKLPPGVRAGGCAWVRHWGISSSRIRALTWRCISLAAFNWRLIGIDAPLMHITCSCLRLCKLVMSSTLPAKALSANSL